MFIYFSFLLVSGPVEADPEYRLIVAANNLTVEIDNELSELVVPGFVEKNALNVKCLKVVLLLLTVVLKFFCLITDIIHKFTRDKYSKRFPELESLVPDSLDYIRTVKVR